MEMPSANYYTQFHNIIFPYQTKHIYREVLKLYLFKKWQKHNNSIIVRMQPIYRRDLITAKYKFIKNLRRNSLERQAQPYSHDLIAAFVITIYACS